MKKVDFIKEISKECKISITQATKLYYEEIEKEADETIVNALKITSVDEHVVKIGLTDNAKACVRPLVKRIALKYGTDKTQHMMHLYYEMHINFMKLVTDSIDDMTAEQVYEFEQKLYRDAKLTKFDESVQDEITKALVALHFVCDLSLVSAETILYRFMYLGKLKTED